jgi:hypothetical protein
MWELRPEYPSQQDGVWAVFRTHEEVCNSPSDVPLRYYQILKR